MNIWSIDFIIYRLHHNSIINTFILFKKRYKIHKSNQRSRLKSSRLVACWCAFTWRYITGNDPIVWCDAINLDLFFPFTSRSIWRCPAVQYTSAIDRLIAQVDEYVERRRGQNGTPSESDHLLHWSIYQKNKSHLYPLVLRLHFHQSNLK